MLAYIDPGTGYVVLGAGGAIAVFFMGFFGFLLLFFKKIVRFFKKHFKPIISFLAFLVLISTVILGALFMGKSISPFDKKIIILGFDGLSPDIIDTLMDKGELPNFSKLKSEGSYSRLSTTNPPQSPVAWAGFATGRNPGKHGIFDFIVRDPSNYGLSLSLSKFEKGKLLRVINGDCFWQYASEKNIPMDIIACPVTFPPDKINGNMLSGMGVTDILGTEGTFTFYTSEPVDDKKDIGGKVFEVKRSPLMVISLIGPKAMGRSGRAENIKVPVKVSLSADGKTAVLEYQKKKFTLSPGKWSAWQEVTFDIGLFKKMRGIFKCYMPEMSPGFKLYISPINYDPRDAFFPISSPVSYSKKLAERIGLFFTQGMPFPTWALNEKRLTEDAFLEQAEEILNEKRSMLDTELANFKNGILFCYFGSPDVIQHMFWRYIDPSSPLYEKDAPEKYKTTIYEWYRKMDSILGKVMEQASGGDVVIVLSDHGYGPFRRAVHVNSWLRANGYLELKDPNAPEGGELLADIDWSRTKAYSIGFGAIYVNQKGREAEGIVSPGEDTERLKTEISEKIRTWLDAGTNSAVIHNIYKREDIFWGELSGTTPDMYIGFNKGYRASWQTAIGGVPKVLIEDNTKKWSGDHLFDPILVPGVIFSNKKITKENPSIYDIAPTILKEAGISEKDRKKCDFDGGPLF